MTTTKLSKTTKLSPNSNILRTTIKNAISLLKDGLNKEALDLLESDYDYYLSLVRDYENKRYETDEAYKEKRKTSSRNYQRNKREEKKKNSG